ncbi:dienelactone hydrolase family protein [Pseudarthrobacter sp. BIM B-2242]|uniref:dienelactone hydrolase family protein n=1 Tax=Pseudarthrobacter sp. BIM B-2242 TaxID=2772401 RepID=UPI00168A9072|nr:dienelactone hydrolase family protein [Pseudarthrobacter sp. BIM B-2242]QOD02737.1 dienelactone hydrolase family protein [Pseudarthrobacter sp. BIM B-2242]
MTYVDLSAESAAAGGSPSLGGYLARPAGAGPFPAVLMIHEAFGLNDSIRGHAERLARAGYLTLAVDLFSDGGARRCVVSTMRSMMTGSGRVFTDLATARTWLAKSPLSTGKTGVIGFCMGGGFALLVARDGFDAASVNYGRLPRDLEGALRGACPIVANFGAKDTTLKGAARRLETALDNLGIENDVKEFPTAGHAFLNETDLGPAVLRPLMRVMGIGPDPESAPEAWQRIEDHFARHLKGSDNPAV